jgi:hypothetical protein
MATKHPIVILQIETEGNYRAFYADTESRVYIAEDDENEVYHESVLQDRMEDVIRRAREH